MHKSAMNVKLLWCAMLFSIGLTEAAISIRTQAFDPSRETHQRVDKKILDHFIVGQVSNVGSLAMSLPNRNAMPPSQVTFFTKSAICSKKNVTKGNSTYGRNRELIFSSLASKVIAQGGYYNATLGREPNRIYAMALCRGGYNTEDCFSCINAVAQELIAQCSNQTEAYIWGGDILCFVRYSDVSFFGSVSLEPFLSFYNLQDIIVSNMTLFDQIWDDLMVGAVTKASAGSHRLKYAAERAELSNFQTIYAITICTPDVSSRDCNFCLQECLFTYQACCHGYRGGGVYRRSCFFGWELFAFRGASFNLLRPLSPPPRRNETTKKGNRSLSSRTLVSIVVPTVIIVMVIAAIASAIYRRRRLYRKLKQETDSLRSLRFDFSTIRDSTNDFSNENKLGQGGFGTVYKGKLPDGEDIAVKRLSEGSGQGEREFKNEVLLVARLQHRNLARLLGFSLEGIEKLLIYEFAPNKSLDSFLSDQGKRRLTHWQARYKIIEGIARGLVYLHEDSQLKIIHLDLKASNILLDADMNPKISDFGMAKLFALDQTQGEASRIVGTYGYMAPEYMKNGQISAKCDVYSFGVLVLEILTGQMNNNFRVGDEEEALVAYAWRLWREGKPEDLADPVIQNGSASDMIRCIHIGLLCVQENVVRRPTMSLVALWLSSESITLPVPSTPAYFTFNRSEVQTSSVLMQSSESINELTITEADPR